METETLRLPITPRVQISLSLCGGSTFPEPSCYAIDFNSRRPIKAISTASDKEPQGTNSVEISRPGCELGSGLAYLAHCTNYTPSVSTEVLLEITPYKRPENIYTPPSSSYWYSPDVVPQPSLPSAHPPAAYSLRGRASWTRQEVWSSDDIEADKSKYPSISVCRSDAGGVHLEKIS